MTACRPISCSSDLQSVNVLELRYSTGAVFLNFSFAIYSTWYDELLFKMQRDGINQ